MADAIGLVYPGLDLTAIIRNEVFGDKLCEEERRKVKIPATVKLYVSIGFKICGKPLYNAQFCTYDIPMFIDTHNAPKFFLER